jgi:hypothetical protein
MTAVTRARSDQARMSSMAAQARATAPTAVPCMRRSWRMRASTGNAVTDMEAPMKRAKGMKSMPSGR